LEQTVLAKAQGQGSSDPMRECGRRTTTPSTHRRVRSRGAAEGARPWAV